MRAIVVSREIPAVQSFGRKKKPESDDNRYQRLRTSNSTPYKATLLTLTSHEQTGQHGYSGNAQPEEKLPALRAARQEAVDENNYCS